MSGPVDYRRYLDPKVLAKIDSLELRARLAIEGYVTGTHRSPYRGLSVEFADHRSYAQGDDIRHIDWKVYGRTDKFYIKEYEQETNLNCMLVVDQSASMAYRSPGAPMSKRDYAACIAASLAYLALHQHDSVGLATFDDRVRGFVRPSNHPSHWKTLVRELDQPTGSGKTDIGTVLGDLADRLGRRTLVILVSDLFDETESVLRGLKHLRYHKNAVIVCHVWDPAELRFEFKMPTEFHGLETGGRVLAEPSSIRSGYLDEVRRFISAIRRGCLRVQSDYALYDTSTALDVAIASYLATRAARLRSRSSRVLGRG
jgi:uncharacterized protein (DUF58 family)